MAEKATIEGADRVASTLRDAAGDLADFTGPNSEVAALVAGVAQRLAPRLTGALSASTVGTGEKTEAAVSSPLVYAPVIHNGWPAHHIAPNPYIAEAFEVSADEWMRLYEKAVAEIAGQVKGI